MELVTGKGATDHVSSADMASLYRGLLIADDAVLDTGDKLACTMLDANTAEIGTGDCMLQAHHARVEVAEQLTVRSGSQGFNRNDLVVARYTLGDNNVQAVYLAVIEGTAVAGEASDPAYAEGDIDGGDTLVEFPIWRIPISGVNVGTPERVMPTVDTLQSQITGVRESVNHWDSVSQSDWITLNNGFSLTTFEASYNSALHLFNVKVYVKIDHSISQGNIGIGTVKAAYRPAQRGTIVSTEIPPIASGPIAIDSSGSTQIMGAPASSANKTFYFAGEYTVK